MSNRYGRRQKRLARSKIEELENSVLQQKIIFEKQKHILSMVQDWDKEIVHLLGKESAFRLETTQTLFEKIPENLRIHSSPTLYAGFQDISGVSELTTTIHNLRKLMVIIKKDPEQYKSIIRLIASDGKNSTMFVDDQYFARNGLTERDMKWLVEDIARQFTEHFNKEYKKND